MIRDFCQGIEPVVGEYHGAAGLEQKDFGAATNRVAVVDHHDFYARQSGWFRQFLAPAISSQNGACGG
jgi:hypothetical protein